jgi:hemerythrin superfamily protein
MLLVTNHPPNPIALLHPKKSVVRRTIVSTSSMYDTITRQMNTSATATTQPGSHDTGIVSRIKTDHRLATKMFSEFERLETLRQSDKKQDRLLQLGHEIIKELSVHAFVEEEVLYPTFKQYGMEAELKHSLEEHQGLKNDLYKLDQMTEVDQKYLQTMKAIIKETLHHMKEEEEETLAKFSKQAPVDVLVKLGEDYEAKKSMAPTRPHPSAPNKPPGSTMAGLGAAVVDKVKDKVQGRT